MDSNPPTTLRCLHYLPEMRLEKGGVIRVVIDLLDRLSHAGVQPTLITHDAADCPASWAKPGPGHVNVVTVPWPTHRGLRVPAQSRLAVPPIVAEQDIMHLHTPWEAMNHVIVRAAQRQGKPYLVSLHGMLDDWCVAQSGFKKRTYMKLIGTPRLNRAAYVHCTASGEVEQSRKWYPQGRPIVIPCLVELAPYAELPSPDTARDAHPYLQKPGVKLLFLSRLHVKKGLDRLIAACGELHRRGVAFELGSAGPGEDDYVDELKALAKHEGVADRCHFLGMVAGQMKRSLYAASDLFVLPTSQENFGLVFPESLLCGTPVIATKGTDIWQELKEAGGVISEMHPQSLAKAIAPMAALDNAQRRELGQRGRSYIYDWLDPEKIIERFKAAYREAIIKEAS